MARFKANAFFAGHDHNLQVLNLFLKSENKVLFYIPLSLADILKDKLNLKHMS